VVHVRTDVSEELSASFIRVTRIGELGTTLFLRSVRRLLVTATVVPSSPILVTLMKEALSQSLVVSFCDKFLGGEDKRRNTSQHTSSVKKK
jgi:hypothetical protein